MQEAGIAVGRASQGHLLVGGSRTVANGVQASQTYWELYWNGREPCETGLVLLWQQDDKKFVSVVLGYGDAC